MSKTCSGYVCGHKGCNLPLTAEKDKFVTEGGTCTFTRDGDLTFNGYLGLSGRSIPQHANTYQEKISEDLLGETDAFCMKSEFLGNAGKTQIDSLNVTYLYGQNVAQEGTALYCDEQSSETDYCYYYLEETADSLVGSGGTSSIQFTLPEDSDLVIYKAYVAFGAMNPGEYESSANTACSAAYDSGNGELDCSLSCMTNECTDANGFNSQSSCSGSVIGSTNQLDVKLNSVSLGNVQALDWGNLTCAGMCEAERTQYCQEESTLKPLVSCEKCRQGRTFWVADSNREQGAGYTSTNPLACYYVDHRGHGYENVFTTTVTTGLATAGAQCNDDVSNVCRERGFGTTYPPGNDKCIDVTYDGNNKYSDGCEYETNLLDADHFGHCINNFESSCYPYTTCSDTYNVFCWCTDTTCEDYPGGVGVGFDETTVVTEWYGEYDYDYNLIDVTEMADGLQAGVNTLAVSGTDARLENVGVFVIYKLPDD